MKLLVNIDDDAYYDIKQGKIYTSVRDVPLEAVLAIANGTPIGTMFTVDKDGSINTCEDVTENKEDD